VFERIVMYVVFFLYSFLENILNYYFFNIFDNLNILISKIKKNKIILRYFKIKSSGGCGPRVYTYIILF
jgi:hypothetical protein